MSRNIGITIGQRRHVERLAYVAAKHAVKDALGRTPLDKETAQRIIESPVIYVSVYSAAFDAVEDCFGSSHFKDGMHALD